ncbi:DUF6191 domain-containing protein [Actinomadura montaniterrae]|uniref:Uncharacterized protein n=1 Tax=Actinomadura montaniterrae TaxID=1803903 RepID=A0A6L3VLQ8_9ACTN|nr:DUF6191 domain-containing protein [Actinomadura montaniterrae]KAB2373216.1 hypothetical protein F9B16_28960 [Actinomadura montaniterrae]
MALVVFLTIPGLVIGLVGFAVLDRAGLWAHRRFRLPWRRDEVGRPVSAVAVGELDAFFQGTHRHAQEQRRSSLMLRDEEDDGAPPRGRVDLDAGTAVVRRPRGRA